MQRKLHISNDLFLPQDTITSTLIVYGGKGMGKTNFGSVLVEELTRASLRWSVLDPLGVWWGLRHSSDGKGQGIECLVLGGSHADIPIEPTGGSIVADLVVDETANVVIDFSRKPSGEMWGIGERIRFVTDYAYRLFQRQGELVKGLRREPIFQILDEAARYIPQIIPSGAAELAKCVSAWEQLVEEGRNIGVGVGLLTQRSARMNKSVSEVADAILAFRIVGPNSIGAITDWLGEHVPKAQVNSMVETIRSLERGRCLVVSPGWLKFEGVIGIRKRDTYDSSATPKPGERAQRVHGEGAKPDLAKYVERMKATIEKAKADDPRELRAIIAELKKQLSKQKPVEQKMAGKVVEKSSTADRSLIRRLRQGLEQSMKIIANIAAIGFDDAAVKPDEIKSALDKAAVEIGRMAERSMDRRSREFDALKHNAESLLKRLEKLIAGEDVELNVSVTRNEPVTVRPVTTRPRLVPRAGSNGSSASTSLPPGERAVMIAVGQFGSVEREQLTVLTGYKRSSRDAYISRLAARGYIEIQGRTLRPTQSGIDSLGGDYEPLPTGSALYEHWRNRLPEGELKILDILVKRGSTIERGSLDDLTEYKRSSRDAYLSRLMAKRLIEVPQSGMVKAADALFD